MNERDMVHNYGPSGYVSPKSVEEKMRQMADANDGKVALANRVHELEAEVARLTAELAEVKTERDNYLAVLSQVDEQLPGPGGDPANGVKRMREERDGLAAALNSLQSAARAVAHYHRTGYGPEVHRRFHDLIDHLDAMAAQTEAATVKEFSKVQPEEGAIG